MSLNIVSKLLTISLAGGLLTQCFCNEDNLINKIECSKDSITYYFNKKLYDSGYLRQDSYTVSYYNNVNLKDFNKSLQTIPFITAYAPIVWLTNKDFKIDEMDEDLYFSLERIKKVFKFFWPNKLWQGNIVPCKLIKNNILTEKTFNTDTAIFFSHGLDAVGSVFSHYNDHPLLVTMIRAKLSEANEAIFKNRVTDFSKKYKYPSLFFKTNFDTAINYAKIKVEFGDALNFSLVLSGAAFPIIYQAGIEKLLIASSFTKNRPFPCGSHPLIDNTISFAGIKTSYDQSEFNRIEKIKKIISFCDINEVPIPYILVCCSPAKNCGHCEKCLRTINELLAIGEEPSTFGFSLSINEAILRTKNFLKGDVSNRNHPAANYFWNNIKTYIKNNPDNLFYKQTDEAYFKWIACLPLPQEYTYLPLEQDAYYLPLKKLFIKLWEQSINGVVDYDTFPY